MLLDSSTSGSDAGTPYLLVLAAFYFLPTVVALARGKVNPGGAVVVNLLLGWTLIGWIVALAMAASGTTKKQVQAASPKPPAQVQLSPDGRFWWDGRQWQPMPGAGPPGR